ncbi:MAG: gltJ [Betaproteobacteria bacterium]|nr:gltJ [Betaproteobacteria bacterium]
MDLKILLEQVPDGDGTWLMSLASGLKYTMIVAALAWIIAFVLGSILGVMRTTENKWAVRLGNAYVEIFRNVPLLVQFFVWFFVLPNLFVSTKHLVNSLDPLTYQLGASVLCLGTFTAARIAEQVRAGIQSLPRGQRDAGYAMGLSQAQTYRYILLPVAYRIIIPPMTSELMNLIKNTALGYSIGLVELFFRTREMGEMTFRYYEAFTAATVAYVVIAMIANRAMAVIEKRTAIPGFISGASAGGGH